MTEIDAIFDNFTCVVCFEEYSQCRVPIVVCVNHHIICDSCQVQIQGTSYENQYDLKLIFKIRCPICNAITKKSDFIRFRNMCEIKAAAQKIKERERSMAAKIEELSSQRKKLQEQLVTIQLQHMYLEGLFDRKKEECKCIRGNLGVIQLQGSPISNRQKSTCQAQSKVQITRLRNQNNHLQRENLELRLQINSKNQFIMKIADKLLRIQHSQAKIMDFSADETKLAKIELLVSNLEHGFFRLEQEVLLSRKHEDHSRQIQSKDKYVVADESGETAQRNSYYLRKRPRFVQQLSNDAQDETVTEPDAPTVIKLEQQQGYISQWIKDMMIPAESIANANQKKKGRPRKNQGCPKAPRSTQKRKDRQ